MNVYFMYLVFDQHGKYGSGGWSRKAKHGLLPRVVEGFTEIHSPVFHAGARTDSPDWWCSGKVTVDGVNRLKLNLLVLEPHIARRVDYPDIVPDWWKDPIKIQQKFNERMVTHGQQSAA